MFENQAELDYTTQMLENEMLLLKEQQEQDNNLTGGTNDNVTQNDNK